MQRLAFSSGSGMFSRQMFETLRIKLINSYHRKKISSQPFEPTSISLEVFVSMMTKWLQYANTPYLKKNDHGVFYAEDYVKYFAPGEESKHILGLSHPEYWDISTHSCFFRAKEGHPANQTLSAFFEGPTFADCGNVLQACVYRVIEQMVGTDEFNRLFGMSLTPFLITPILYNKIYSEAEKPGYSLDFRSNGGNPLLFLFDKLNDNLTENDINPGDILYIKGVDKYPKKHLVGSGNGWNVICIGKNTNGENLYLGFGPETFTMPLTYKEVKSVLIKYYNAEQLLDTKKMIEKVKVTSNVGLDENQILFNAQAFLAGALTDDKVNDDYPIVGIQYVIRFNKEKLEHFLKNRVTAWHSLSFEELERKCKLREPTLDSSVKQITAITIETRGKSFIDYEAKTPTQIEMLTIARKFALAVCGERSASIGLVMTGMPGIGKTHLSIAIADHVSKRSLKVVFVDEETIGNLYQKMSEQRHAPVSDSEMDCIFTNWLKGADLIVLDDINSKYGIGASFLKMVIKYAMKNNKAIMISANKPLCSIQENLPDYIGYDDERANNFFIIQGIKGMSYRKTWWSNAEELHSSSGVLRTNDDAMEILANLNADQAAGIILEEKNNIDLEQISKKYFGLSPDKNIRIRILQEPYRNQRVFDMYVHDFDQHDVFFIKVDGDWGQCEQLLKLISHVHDHGKKLIVVTNNEDKLLHGIQKELNSYTHEDQKQRLTDRANNLLLKKADWSNSDVKISSPPDRRQSHLLINLPPASSQPELKQKEPKITIGPCQTKVSYSSNESHNSTSQPIDIGTGITECTAGGIRMAEMDISDIFSSLKNNRTGYRYRFSGKRPYRQDKELYPLDGPTNLNQLPLSPITKSNDMPQPKETYCGLKPGFLKKM